MIEMPFVRLFAGRLTAQEVAERLVEALEEGEERRADGTVEVSGGYRILLNADDLQALQTAHPDLETMLTAALEGLVQQMGLRLRGSARIRLEGSLELPPQAIRISPLTHATEETTREMPSTAAPLLKGERERPRAHLIIGEGKRTFELRQPEIRIGRAADNDLILDDRTVSRHHARLKRRYHRYILTDLGSRSGIQVNDFPVQEIILRNGDRIKIGSVTLLYVEER